MYAARGNHAEVISILLDHGAEIDPPTDIGVTALLLAAYDGHDQVVQILAERGANLKARLGGDGATPLLLADRRGHQSTVNLLVDYGDEAPPLPPRPTCCS